MRLIPPFLAILTALAPSWAAENLDAALAELATGVLSSFGEAPPEKIAISTMIHGDGQCSDMTERASNRFQGVLFTARPHGTDVIDRRTLSAIFREQDLIEDGTVSPEGAATIARIAQVDAIVTGTVSRYGQRIELESSIIDAVTGTLLGFARSDFPMTENDLVLLANKSLATCNFANAQRTGSSGNGTPNPPPVGTPPDNPANVFTAENFEVSIVSLSHDRAKGDVTTTLRFRNTSDKKIGLAFRSNTLSVSDNQGRLFEQGEQWSGLRICDTSLSYCHGGYPKYMTSIAAGTQAQVTFNAIGESDTDIGSLSMQLEMVMVSDLDNETTNSIVSVGFFDVQPNTR